MEQQEGEEVKEPENYGMMTDHEGEITTYNGTTDDLRPFFQGNPKLFDKGIELLLKTKEFTASIPNFKELMETEEGRKALIEEVNRRLNQNKT